MVVTSGPSGKLTICWLVTIGRATRPDGSDCYIMMHCDDNDQYFDDNDQYFDDNDEHCDDNWSVLLWSLVSFAMINLGERCEPPIRIHCMFLLLPDMVIIIIISTIITIIIVIIIFIIWIYILWEPPPWQDSQPSERPRLAKTPPSVVIIIMVRIMMMMNIKAMMTIPKTPNMLRRKTSRMR